MSADRTHLRRGPVARSRSRRAEKPLALRSAREPTIHRRGRRSAPSTSARARDSAAAYPSWEGCSAAIELHLARPTRCARARDRAPAVDCAASFVARRPTPVVVYLVYQLNNHRRPAFVSPPRLSRPSLLVVPRSRMWTSCSGSSITRRTSWTCSRSRTRRCKRRRRRVVVPGRRPRFLRQHRSAERIQSARVGRRTGPHTTAFAL